MKSKGMDNKQLLIEIGIRAIDYYLDIGECLFCNVHIVDAGHEEHCSLFGLLDAELKVYVDTFREDQLVIPPKKLTRLQKIESEVEK